jgi:hypothetical protein
MSKEWKVTDGSYAVTTTVAGMEWKVIYEKNAVTNMGTSKEWLVTDG